MHKAMPVTLHIAWRFLAARRRAMAMTLAGVAFGVALFILTQAQTSGFEHFFMRTVIEANGALRVQDRYQDSIRSIEAGGPGSGSDFEISARGGRRYVEGIEDTGPVLEAVRRFENVTGAAAVLRGNVLVHSVQNDESAQLWGIDLDEYLGVTDLGRRIVQGSLADFRADPQGLLMGSTLAGRLDVRLGDSIVIEFAGDSRRFRVDGIFSTGISDVDRTRMFGHMGEARSLLRRPTGATFIVAGVNDAERAPADALRLREVLNHHVTSWQERERTWLEAFRALRISAVLTVGAIMVVSGLGMFNTLAILVMEKRREIAILRSMGYARADIAAVFLWQGAMVAAAGAMTGWMIGALATWGVSRIPIRIRGIFSADSFVVEWSAAHYLVAAAAAAVVIGTAALMPARRAARIEPADVLRGDGA